MQNGPAAALVIIKSTLWTLLALFLIPALAYGFVSYAQPRIDADYVRGAEQSIARSQKIAAGDKSAIQAFVRANPPSIACDNIEPSAQSYRESVCGQYTMMWQYKFAGLTAWWALAAGVIIIAAILALGLLALINRRSQYVSFVAGWQFLRAASALEVVVQGALAVWLSYWVTAYFFSAYSIKLVGIAAVLAVLASFYAISWIFRTLKPADTIDGITLQETEEPKLWSRVRTLADALETEPPHNIVAGIDANFFVSENPMTVRGHALQGRTLFVSLPLLRVLDATEADAVLAHELAHLRGGDAKNSAKLGYKLLQFDYYWQTMRAKGVWLTYQILYFYRLLFEFALKRERRHREFVADRIAAAAVSSKAVVHALLKVAAYASYRQQIERSLFEHNRLHGGVLDIGNRVASGLTPFAASAQFADYVRLSNIPHPFDSHPSLSDRMSNVGYVAQEADFPEIITRATSTSWIEDIETAQTIEGELWNEYEQQFVALHERNLAYRYRPENPEEAALVGKYFPAISFGLRSGKKVEIDHRGVTLPGERGTEAVKIPWSRVVNLSVKSNTLRSDQLSIHYTKPNSSSATRTAIRVGELGKDRKQFEQTFAAYLHRHRSMEQWQSANAPQVKTTLSIQVHR